MTASEAASFYGKSRSTIYRWIASGRLVAEKIGRRWAIRVANAAIKAVAKSVEAVREVINPEAPAVPLWQRFRTSLHGF